MPLSPTTRRSGGNLLAQTERVLQVGVEGAEVAVVHAHQPAPAANTRGRLAGSYNSTSGVMPKATISS